MGMQCESATLPDAVCPFTRQTVCVTVPECGDSVKRMVTPLLQWMGRPSLLRIESEDLPFAVWMKPSRVLEGGMWNNKGIVY